MTPRDAFLHDMAMIFGPAWNSEHELTVGALWDYSVARKLGEVQRDLDATKEQVRRLSAMVGRS